MPFLPPEPSKNTVYGTDPDNGRPIKRRKCYACGAIFFGTSQSTCPQNHPRKSKPYKPSIRTRLAQKLNDVADASIED